MAVELAKALPTDKPGHIRLIGRYPSFAAAMRDTSLPAVNDSTLITIKDTLHENENLRAKVAGLETQVQLSQDALEAEQQINRRLAARIEQMRAELALEGRKHINDVYERDATIATLTVDVKRLRQKLEAGGAKSSSSEQKAPAAKVGDKNWEDLEFRHSIELKEKDDEITELKERLKGLADFALTAKVINPWWRDSEIFRENEQALLDALLLGPDEFLAKVAQLKLTPPQVGLLIQSAIMRPRSRMLELAEHDLGSRRGRKPRMVAFADEL